jgi:hypothetical protein
MQPSTSSPLNVHQLPDGLNAAQMQMVQQALRDFTNKMQLRQWCVEKALSVNSTDPIKLAHDIYWFVVGTQLIAEETKS